MKILFVTYKYYPKPGANAVCVQEIAKTFIAEGHTVNVLAYQDDSLGRKEKLAESYIVDGVTVYTIKPDFRMQLFYYADANGNMARARVARQYASAISKIKQLLYMPLYPLYSIGFPLRLANKIACLQNEHSYDVIVGTFSPFDTIPALLKVKKIYSNIRMYVLAFDSFINQRRKFVPEQYRSADFWVRKALDELDGIIYMKSRAAEFARYQKNASKLFVADIPLLTLNQIEMPQINMTHDKNVSDWVYAGTLGLPHYDVTHLIWTFLEISKRAKIVLHFYSSGSGLNKIRELENMTHGKIKAHDYVEHKKLIEIYKMADVLVSVKSSNQISAKIFEYMTYGKPIVHFSEIEEDPDYRYVEAYSKGIVIKTWEIPKEEWPLQLEKALANLNDVSEMPTMDMNKFIMNRPEYIRDILLDN